VRGVDAISVAVRVPPDGRVDDRSVRSLVHLSDVVPVGALNRQDARLSRGVDQRQSLGGTSVTIRTACGWSTHASA
jgi:hypothetical protein